MKTTLFIIALFFSLTSFGQFTKPTGAVTIPTYSMYRTAADSGVHIYQGSTSLWNSFVMKFDTVKLKGYKTVFSSRVQNITTNSTYYPLFTNSTSGKYLAYVSSTQWTFNPNSGIMIVPEIQSPYITASTELLLGGKVYIGSYGTSGQVLTSGGSGAGVSWTTPIVYLSKSADDTSTGNITAVNFILSSDSTLKTNIKPISWKKANQIRWVNFESKAKRGVTRAGVVAQELEKTYPDFVTTDDNGKKAVMYIDLLVTKIAELEERIKVLEKTTKKKNTWKAEQCKIDLP